MKKKYRLINILIILVILLITIVPNYCYSSNTTPSKGTSSSNTTPSKGTSSSNTTPSKGTDLGLGNLEDYKGTNVGSTKLQKKANYIFSVLRVIGIVLSVVILIVIGIKYMLGSIEEKAKYKETLWPYIVGAFILFTGSLIPQIIYDFMQNF